MIKKEQTPKKTIVIWFLRFLFGFMLLTICFIGLKNYKAIYISAILAGIAFIYLLLFFITYKIELKDKSVVLEKGIIFRTTHIIPYKKIVYIKTAETALLKALGLGGVIIKTLNGVIFLPEQKSDFVKLITEKFREKNI